MRGLVNKSWIRAILKNRMALLIILLLIEMQFFTINMLNTQLRDPHDGWELKIGVVDNHLTPNGIWLVPYFVGFFFTVLVPLWAMFYMPNKLYRQFVLAVVIAALFSYTIYVLFPTYVVKPAPDRVPGDGFFARALRRTYEADAAASSHNAAPSQHVFYALLNMCFMIRFRPRPRVFCFWVTLAALICASTLLTMRHNSPDLIAGYLVAVGAYYTGSSLGESLTDLLGDENDPVVVPGRVGRMHQRLRAYRRARRRIKADAV
jgi:membrane-associated phospholipid phosphatase